ncbi:hypothetical protein KTT_04280 [Tengunoibacter tsumagoiensis]|uniref:Uncharacterized protein n=1 Tax=Tengunoibacter tsumagoiensis TaxID=2014871 RepID=A0A401ZUH6_9CHLR|nr:hypothetical protein KTT_04280 [Tengunoibacter tsumagoiensis]
MKGIGGKEVEEKDDSFMLVSTLDKVQTITPKIPNESASSAITLAVPKTTIKRPAQAGPIIEAICVAILNKELAGKRST